MPQLIILGSSNAIPTINHENTHLAIVGDKRVTLIDCAGNPIVRLAMAGIDLNNLKEIILTHFHPDHVSGVPLLLMDMWLLGRTMSLEIHGLEPTIDRFIKMMDLFDWEQWPGFFPVNLHRLQGNLLEQLSDNEEWVVYSSPVKHLIPNIGVRIESKYSGKVLAYSSDTEPVAATIQLAQQADILIHEAAGKTHGHSDSVQAAEIAQKARVKQLYLIHYDNGEKTDPGIISRAEEVFDGQIILAEDFMQIDF